VLWLAIATAPSWQLCVARLSGSWPWIRGRWSWNRISHVNRDKLCKYDSNCTIKHFAFGFAPLHPFFSFWQHRTRNATDTVVIRRHRPIARWLPPNGQARSNAKQRRSTQARTNNNKTIYYISYIALHPSIRQQSVSQSYILYRQYSTAATVARLFVSSSSSPSRRTYS